MAKLNLDAKPPKKLLLLGDSGSGKTGAFVALAQAGYNIKIVDFDAQAEEVILSITKLMGCHTQEVLDRFDVEVFTDKITIVAGKPTVMTATAWVGAMNQLNKWYREGLTPQDIVIIDSLTFAARAATHQYQALNKVLNRPIAWQDYGRIQQMILDLLQLLYTPAFNTNVIVSTHVDLVETQVDTGKVDEKGNPIMKVVDTKGLPMSLGKAIAPIIPQFFNSALVCRTEGPENKRQRFIHTTPIGMVDTKCPFPGLPPKLPLATGLRTIFEA